MVGGRTVLALVLLGLLQGADRPARAQGGAAPRAVAAGADLARLVKEAAPGETLQLAAGEYRGSISLEGKPLTIRGDRAGRSILVGGAQPAAVLVTGGAELALEDVDVRPGGDSGNGVVVKGAAAVLRRVRVSGATQSGGHVEDGRLEVDGSSFDMCRRAAVSAFGPSDVQVSASAVTTAGEVGLYARGARRVTVRGSRFEMCPQAVFVEDGSGPVTIESTVIRGAPSERSHAGVALRGLAELGFHRNLVTGYPCAVDAAGTGGGAVALTGNMLLANGGGIRLAVAPGAPVTVSRNLIVGPSSYGMLLEGTHASSTRNVVLAGEGVGLVMKPGARIEAREDFILAGRAPALVDTTGSTTATRMSAVLVHGAVQPPQLRPSDEAAARFEAVMAGSRAGVRLRVASAAALAATTAADPLDALERESGELAGALAAARREMGRAARVTLEVVDSTGASRRPGFAAWRAAGSVRLGTSPVTTIGPGGAGAWLMPGTYQLVPDGLPGAAGVIALRAGEQATRTVRVDGSLWLDAAAGEGPGRELLFRFGDRAARRRCVQAIGSPAIASTMELARPEATPAERADALATARAVLRKTQRSVPPAGLTTDQRWNWEFIDNLARGRARSILAAIGEREDAKRLVADLLASGTILPHDMLMVGQLEIRYGALASGELTAMLGSANRRHAAAAAAALHVLGLDAGDGVLLQAIADPASAEFGAYSAFALLDSPSAPVLAALREVLARPRADGERSPPWITVPASLGLIASGDIEDWKRVAARPVSGTLVNWLAYLVTEPDPVIEHSAEAYEVLAEYSQSFRRWHRAAQDGVWRRCLDAVYLAAERAAAAGRSTTGADTRRNTFEGLAAFHRPSALIAKMYHEKLAQHGEAPWLPAPWLYGEALAAFERGELNGFALWRLDHIPIEDLARTLATDQARDKLRYPEVYLAYRRVATRAFVAPQDRYRDGAERRAYTLTRPGVEGGSLSGVLAVRPWVAGGRLHVALKVDQKHHVSRTFISRQPDSEFEIYRYVARDGRALIGDVTLRGTGGALRLEPAGTRPDGTHVFSCAFAGEDLAGRVLDVALAFFDRRPVLTFDLGLSDRARRSRILAHHVAVWDEVVQQPGAAAADWASRARALDALGKTDDARTSFARARALAPRDERLAGEVVAFDVRRGAVREAGALLEELGEDGDLAALLFKEGRYLDAGLAASRAAATERTAGIVLLQAASAYMVGDREGASRLLAPLLRSRQGRRLFPLWYVSTPGARGSAIAQSMYDRCPDGAFKTELALLLGKRARAPLPEFKRTSDAVRARCFAGYAALFSGEGAEAGKLFASALALARSDQLEHRLSQFELDALGTGGTE